MILQIIIYGSKFFKIIESVIILINSSYIYILNKIMNINLFIEIDIMISYSYKKYSVSVIIINHL